MIFLHRKKLLPFSSTGTLGKFEGREVEEDEEEIDGEEEDIVEAIFGFWFGRATEEFVESRNRPVT